MYEEQMKKEGI